MVIKPANGTVGYLLRLATGDIVFRVYSNAPHEFTDYDILHYDMRVQIQDDDAYFYEDEHSASIDHAPETLGHTK